MPVVIGGLVLSFLVMMLFGDSELDRTLLVLLDGDGLPSFSHVASALRWCAQPLPLLVLAGGGTGLLLAMQRWRDAALLGGTVLVGWLLVLTAQHLTLPARPTTGAGPMSGAIYPDMGTALATITGFALAFLLTRRAPGRGWALAGAAGFALAAGVAGIMAAGVWPSSVVGGWALGLAWVLAILLIARADIGDGIRNR